MFKKMMLAIAVVVVPANLALAAEPALEQNHGIQEMHPTELSLPGIVIDKTVDKVEQKIEADCQAYLAARLEAQEQELMSALAAAADRTLLTDAADPTVTPGS